MSNSILIRPRNHCKSVNNFSSAMAPPQGVLRRRVAPLCRLAIVVLAVGGCSCSIATPENQCNDGIAMVDGEPTACALQDGQANNSIEQEILALVNGERRSAGVRPLCFSSDLARVAKQHNRKMASEGFFEHRGEGEQCLLDRVTFAGIGAESVGENIFKAGQPTSDGIAQQCVAMWMQSDGHRRNMLSSDFDKTGVSVSYASNGECYVTQDFAHLAPTHQIAKRRGRRVQLASHRSRTRRRSRSQAFSRVVPVAASYPALRKRHALRVTRDRRRS